MERTYYKATRLDGTDFRTGTVRYAEALELGHEVKHPYLVEVRDLHRSYRREQLVRNIPRTYLSISDNKTGTMVGANIPCRLFEVEPLGDTLSGLQASPHKVACMRLRMIRELDPHMVMGPQGREIFALRQVHLSEGQRYTLARLESSNRYHDIALADPQDARMAASNAARRADLDEPYSTLSYNVDMNISAKWAMRGLLLRHVIASPIYDSLTENWRRAVGSIHPDDAPMEPVDPSSLVPKRHYAW